MLYGIVMLCSRSRYGLAEDVARTVGIPPAPKGAGGFFNMQEKTRAIDAPVYLFYSGR